jgi:hypothetical protein
MEWIGQKDNQLGTGVKASDAECRDLEVLMRLEGNETRCCTVTITVDGVEHKTGDPHECCDLLAQRHGLPALPGHRYGIDEYGEFMASRIAWQAWKLKEVG